MVRVHGKIILAGEHSVVYGHSAVAAPTTLYVDLTETDSGYFVAPDLDLEIPMEAPHGMLDVFRAVVPWDQRPRRSGLLLTGSLPPGLGMGFSAALSVALAHQFCRWSAVAADQVPSRVRHWALAMENHFHGGASGLDVEAVLVPYPIEFQRGQPVRPIEVSGAFHLVGAAFPVVATTKQCVAQVRQMSEADPGAAHRIAALGELASQSAQCLRAGDDRGLGQMFRAIQTHLGFFGLTTAATERAIDVAHEVGAYGAKISGAGGGGLVLAVVPGQEAAELEHRWRELEPRCVFRHVLN